MTLKQIQKDYKEVKKKILKIFLNYETERGKN